MRTKQFGRSKAQSVLEYALLASLAIVAFLALGSFLTNLRDGAFKDHFRSTRVRITGGF
jgi:hypothetical protein